MSTEKQKKRSLALRCGAMVGAQDDRPSQIAVQNALRCLTRVCSGRTIRFVGGDIVYLGETICRTQDAAALLRPNDKIRDAQPREAQGGAFGTQPQKDKS